MTSSLKYYYRNREKINNRRREKNRLWMRAWFKKNHAVALARKREWSKKKPGRFKLWYLRNKSKTIAAVLKWQKEHPAKVQEYRAKGKPLRNQLCRGYVKNLADCYIRAKLSRRSNVPAKAWPDSLVELKRAELKTIRELKLWQHQKT